MSIDVKAMIDKITPETRASLQDRVEKLEEQLAAFELEFSKHITVVSITSDNKNKLDVVGEYGKQVRKYIKTWQGTEEEALAWLKSRGINK
jgi:hypothetical protein